MADTSDHSSDFYEKVSRACEVIIQRQTDDAFDLIEQLQRAQPDSAEVAYLMGLLAVTMDEFGRALVLIEEAHNRDPECFEYADVLANLHVRVGQLNEGLYYAKLSTTLDPHPHIYNLAPPDLANFFESLEQAVIPRHYAVGFMKMHVHDYVEASRELDRAIALDPYHAAAHSLASAARLRLGDIEKAIFHAQKAVELAPEEAEHHLRAGSVSQHVGAFKAALFHYNKVAELEPQSLNLLTAAFAMASDLSDIDTAALEPLEAAMRTSADAQPQRPVEAVPETKRKDRIVIGYVTNAAWNADTAALLMPLLQQHNRDKFEVVIYQQSQGQSAFIQQLNNAADVSHKLWELDDETTAVIISGDQIDVLVNMCTPEPDNRAALFQMSPSIIQVGYLAPNFGLRIPGITHVLADPMSTDAMQKNLGENQKLEVLRPGLMCVNPSYMLPNVAPLPALETGHPTFGALCDPSAWDEKAIALFIDLLRAVPGARLLFGATGTTDTFPKRRLEELFAGSGVADRVDVFRDEGVGDNWLADPGFWQQIDLFIVPGALHHPLRATDALWMGVPVLALRGERPSECMAASILASAAKLEWLSDDREALIKAAKALVEDLESLADLRAGLRKGLGRSALFNPVLRVRDIEAIYTRLVSERDNAAA